LALQSRGVDLRFNLDQMVKVINLVVVSFLSILLEGYVCVIEFDLSEQKRPIKCEVVYKD